MSDEDEKSSWLEPLPEEYAADSDMTGRRMLIAALTVIVLAIFGGLVWYSYMEGNDNGPVPAVRADKSVVKIKPSNPGGLEVPDQDKRVFDRVTADQLDAPESLAPSAEIPVDRPTDATADEMADEVVSEVAPDAASEGQEATTEAVVKPADQGPAKRAVIEGDFLIQLGAFGKKQSAEKLWRKLRQENVALFAGLAPDIMMVDLGKKGVLYRLRGGMLAERASADAICAALKAKKQACIVVKDR